MRGLPALVLLMACGWGGAGDAEPPPFGPWFTADAKRCFPTVESASQCDDGVCLGVLRTATDDEVDLSCLAWPYVGKGTQRLTQSCGDTQWRLIGITQLPPMDSSTAEAALTKRARQVRDILEEWPCPDSDGPTVPSTDPVP